MSTSITILGHRQVHPKKRKHQSPQLIAAVQCSNKCSTNSSLDINIQHQLTMISLSSSDCPSSKSFTMLPHKQRMEVFWGVLTPPSTLPREYHAGGLSQSTIIRFYITSSVSSQPPAHSVIVFAWRIIRYNNSNRESTVLTLNLGWLSHSENSNLCLVIPNSQIWAYRSIPILS